MRLKTLRITNFRCFADVSLELNGMGLIGVRGRNGAGKSSLLEAIEFALFGARRGAGSLPAKRSSARTEDELSVYVEFDFDAHNVEVERTESNATLTIDGVERFSGLSDTSHHVARLLGLSRQQFGATFYARQKEIQSFSEAGRRRENIERLLGLTQLRNATKLAQEHAARQLVVVQTLQGEAGDVDQAKQLLEERRTLAKETAPLVIAARKKRDELKARRAQAWVRLEEAQDFATEAEKARSAHQLATRNYQDAVEKHRLAQTTLATAVEALQEVERLAPVASGASELQAQVREHELRQQSHERYVTTREARAKVQRERAGVTDQLHNDPPPEPSAQSIRDSATAMRSRRDELTDDLLEATERVSALGQQHEKAVRNAQVRVRRAELDAALSILPDVQREEVTARSARAELDGERVAVERRLQDERAHREEVERDGPDAECPRCRRLYGDGFQDILAGFDSLIETLEVRLHELVAELDDLSEKYQRCLDRLQGLQRLQGERNSLPKPDPEVPDDPKDVEAMLIQAEQHQGELRAELGEIAERLDELEAQEKDAADREAARQHLIVQLAQLKAEENLLASQLDSMTIVSYDAEEHQAAVRKYEEASAAARRCSELRHHVDGMELAERRAEASANSLKEASEQHELAETALSGFEGSDEQLEAAQELLRNMDEEIANAEQGVLDAERRATVEDHEVQAAEAAVKRAHAERRKVQAAKREHRYAAATADGLRNYTVQAQRNAVPMLEKETAAFLSRLTGGRYSDVTLDDSGALEIFDDGEPRPLRRFSGGEQDLANLCLRLALSRAFADQRSADPGLIILDEVFGSQDLERRHALLEHLRELNQVFSQVFIVSHFDDVADACDIQIQVKRSGDLSTAELIS